MKRVFVTCKVLDSNIVKNKIQRKIFILDEMIHDLKDFIKMIAQTFEDTRINTLFHKNGFKIDNINELDDNDLLYAEYVEKKHDEDEWINLNVGGRVFQTTKSTLITREPESYFTRFLSHLDECTIEHDEKGLLIIKINRSGRYFEVILDYLRHGKLILDVNLSLEGVLEEAQFYSLKNLIELIKKEIAKRQISVMKPSSKLSRYDVISFLCITKSENNLRFQSVDLQGADLSKLDLSYINFKYANLSGCNLSNCNLSHSSFEKADLSKASLKYAICHGVTMIWTNLEYCDMSSCDFEDLSGKVSNLEGANLSHVNGAGVNMNRINLKDANLKYANFTNSSFRFAKLIGTNMEGTNFQHANMTNANMSGSNITGTLF